MDGNPSYMIRIAFDNNHYHKLFFIKNEMIGIYPHSSRIQANPHIYGYRCRYIANVGGENFKVFSCYALHNGKIFPLDCAILGLTCGCEEKIMMTDVAAPPRQLNIEHFGGEINEPIMAVISPLFICLTCITMLAC